MRCKQVLMMLLGVSLGVMGCAGPSAQLPSQEAIAQVDSQAKHNSLQEQLLKQVAQFKTINYSDYQVGPEDLLAIQFLSTDKLNTEARVNGEGEIGLLLLGNVKVAGLTPSGVAKKLTDLYQKGGYLENPQITVAVKEFRHQQVAVTGAVNKPDSYALIGPRSLLEVLGMAGGLSDKAGEEAYIIRAKRGLAVKQGSPTLQQASSQQPFSPGKETIVVDLNRLLLKGDTRLNLPIENGDVVYIPFYETVYVLGAVSKPGPVPLKNNMTVAKAIAQSGGLQIMLSSNDATILRQTANGQRTTIPVNIGQISKGNEPDVPLKENDIVFVQESTVRRLFFDIKMMLPGSVAINPAMY